MRKFIVIHTPSELGYTEFKLRDALTGQNYDFPPVDTVCHASDRGVYIKYRNAVVCMIDSCLGHYCFKEVT